MVEVKRHMFHYEGMTDLGKIRAQAIDLEKPVVVHLHPYEDEFDGCAVYSQYKIYPEQTHEVYGLD